MRAKPQLKVKSDPIFNRWPKSKVIIQRACSDCPKKQKLLQRRALSQFEPEAVPPIVHEVLRSPGRPLDAETRSFMESRFSHDFSWVRPHAAPQAASLTIGPMDDSYEQEAERVANSVMQFAPSQKVSAQPRYDFSHVRVHDDARAAESARSINSRAYTVGQDIVFGKNERAQARCKYQHLLAHELTHVVQQSDATNNSIVRRLTEIQKQEDLKSDRLRGDLRLQQAFDNDPSMKNREVGEGVKTLQRALRDLGYYMPISFRKTGDADGIFGEETYSTVRQFQTVYGLEADGIAGRETLGELDELYSVEHQLPPCPKELDISESSSQSKNVPGVTCKKNGDTPVPEKPPKAKIEFIQYISPTTDVSDPNKGPEVYCHAAFKANVSGNGGNGKIAFLQDILRSVRLKFGSGHQYGCTLPTGLDYQKYYTIMDPSRMDWFDAPKVGSWNQDISTNDRPSLGANVECLPVGAHVDLYSHDKFRMFVFWEPLDNNLIPLAHVDWEWSILAGFDKMQNGMWETKPWYLHGIYMTENHEGVSPSNQKIITEPVHNENSCPNAVCGIPHI